jgi:hypothetical protein
MITLTARIDLISGNNGTLSSVSGEIPKNNISSEIGAILGSKKQGSNPFILGASKLGDGSTLSGEVDYFIGGVPSNENGMFVPPYEITISGNDITSLTIEFDKVNNRHPNTIKIDNLEYADDDTIFTVNVPSANSHTITIDNWNSPNYPLVITGIYVEISIDIDYRNLIALNRSITYRGDNKLPSYGIISNTGNLEFNDLDGEIKDYAEQLLLTSDLKVEIMLNNTLANTHEQVGVFETRDWDYDNDNRSVSVSLKDDLEEWQDIQVEGFNFDPRNPSAVLTERTMANLYVWLQGQDEDGNYRTPLKYQMLTFEQLDEETQAILENTTIDYPLLENGTLWEQWQKLCQVCGLYIYKNNEGKTVCTYTYGS